MTEAASTGADASTDDAGLVGAADAAFERGDFAEVRAAAARLRASSDPALRQAGEALAAKVGIDPAAIAVWFASAAFFVAVCVHYLGH